MMFFAAVLWRPRICYVFDAGYTGILAAALWRTITRGKVVVDTGDAISELMRLTGNRGRVGLWLTYRLESLAFTICDHLVTRSHTHRDLLQDRVPGITVVPDGVDPGQFASVRRKRREHARLKVGLLGSIVWNRRQEMCYGWELIETLSILRDEPVDGVIIGDGSGLGWLKTRCEELGLSDRLTFHGRVPYESLPGMLSELDVCLSTQTNDGAGQVRTTGKLPLYLASGRYVLASEVGEAAQVLPAGMLVRYEGTKDLHYPARLAERIRTLLANRNLLACHEQCTELARKHFDYDLLAGKIRGLLTSLAPSAAASRIPPTIAALTMAASLAMTPLLYGAPSPQNRNLRNCVESLVGCDIRSLSPQDMTQVAEASRQRNLRKCIEGLPGCDTTRLKPSEVPAVQAARMRRNLDRCLTGSGVCDPSRLTLAEAAAVQKVRRQRNLDVCNLGSSTCDPLMLTFSEQAVVRLAMHRRNVERCLGLSPTCDPLALMPGELKQVAAANSRRNLENCKIAAPSCDPAILDARERAAVRAQQVRGNAEACVSGFSACDPLELSPADKARAQKAYRERSVENCRRGLDSCDLSVLNGPELADVATALQQIRK